jgi:hypothetical protein
VRARRPNGGLADQNVPYFDRLKMPEQARYRSMFALDIHGDKRDAYIVGHAALEARHPLAFHQHGLPGDGIARCNPVSPGSCNPQLFR